MFHSVRKSDSSSNNYDTICDETEHLVQSDSTTELGQSKQRKASQSQSSPRTKLNLINRHKDTQANSGQTGKPPRPPAPPNTGNARDPNDDRPKQRPERPNPPVKAGGQGPTDGPPKQIGDILRPPRPAPPTKVSSVLNVKASFISEIVDSVWAYDTRVDRYLML